jgi:gluconate 5-dehydrogenase
LFDLSGKVALVTGATGHVGPALAAALAESGARVVTTSRDKTSAETAAARLGGAEAGRHLGIALDHMSEASIADGFAEAVRLAGQVDVLVNNGHEPLAADWRTATGEEFTRQLGNATGYFLLARHLRDHVVARSAPASVILLGSMYGMVGSYPDVYQEIGPANPAAYQVLKGGVIQLARHLAVYWARDGVRVNCLSPGAFPAPQANPALVERIAKRSPLGRIGRPEELKGSVVFLASDASSYVTGHNLVVDGGWTAW